MRRTIFVAPVLTLALVACLAGPAAGALAVWWGRYRPRHARAS